MLQVLKNVAGLLTTCVLVLVMLTMYPFLWILSYIGSSYSRTRGGVLQTAVKHYVNHATGRKVTLVGAIHVGKTAYYEQMQQLIDKAETAGAAILYEGVGKIDEEDIGRLPADQREIVHQMHTAFKGMERFGETFFEDDVVYQKKGLQYKDDWVRTDLDMDHVSSLFAEAEIDFLGVKDLDVEQQKDLSNVPVEVLGALRTFFATVIKLLSGIAQVRLYAGGWTRKSRMTNHIIITMRDEVGAKGILQQVHTSDVLSIWGAAHLPGIEQYLLQAGFSLEETEWLDAFWS